MPRIMEIATPLDEDVLLFHGMHGREELGRLSEYQFDLLSKRNDINLDEILGKNVTMYVTLADDTTRYFNGYVTRFSQSGRLGSYFRYAATVRPWMWFLTRTADCRIFQEMTVPEIVEAVFSDHSMADFAFELTCEYRKWTYCVQYRETDFNFVSRLLEHEGIYYYFRHTDGHNTLVLTDSTSKHVEFPGYEELPFIAPGQLARPEREHISSWEFSREIQPGVYVHDDYDLERPSVELLTQKTLPRTYAPSDYEVYDYPGEYLQTSHGEQYANVRIEEFGAQFQTAQAATNARGVAVGYSLTMTDHPRADQNGGHLVIAASYDLEYGAYEGMPQEAAEGAQFRCSFVAMSTADQFRPRRMTPKPFVQGPQTAMVVGPAGDEIYTDNYGRVKVQFHWDRRGNYDENSSCWIRASQPWAGKGWGSVATPRIGQEVIVDFLEGDPDQPIITGRVYNAESQPPFGFPAGAVLSGIKSQTHKGAGYNELSMDDTAGKEKITVHGQYDMNTTIEHDETHLVVGGNRAMTVKSGTNTEVIKGNASLTIQAGTRSVDVTGGDYTAAATGKVSLHGKSTGVIVTGTPNVDVNGTTTVAILSPSVDVGNNLIKIHGTRIELATAGGSIVLDGSGVTVHGAKIQSGADGNHEITGAVVALSGGSGSVELSGAGAAMSGSKVSVSGAGSTEITGGVVKIN